MGTFSTTDISPIRTSLVVLRMPHCWPLLVVLKGDNLPFSTVKYVLYICKLYQVSISSRPPPPCVAENGGIQQSGLFWVTWPVTWHVVCHSAAYIDFNASFPNSQLWTEIQDVLEHCQPIQSYYVQVLCFVSQNVYRYGLKRKQVLFLLQLYFCLLWASET